MRVSSNLMAVATEGLEAWRKGDFETLERILDPDVEWRWFEPGEWDCRNREDVMRTLRERYDQGFAKGRLEFKDGGENAIIIGLQQSAKVTGRDCFMTESATSPEIPYFEATLMAVEAKFCVDKSHLFMEGFSSGSWLTNLIGCAHGNLLTLLPGESLVEVEGFCCPAPSKPLESASVARCGPYRAFDLVT